jgi:hypothetical protein
MRGHRLVPALALAAAIVAPASAAPAARVDLPHRVAEIASLYGVPARTATVVETTAAGRPAGLRDAALPPRRRVAVAVLDGAPTRVRLPDRGRVGVVEVLLEPRSGRVLAAAVERRRADLGRLGPTRRVRLPALGAEAPPAVTGLGFDDALMALRAAGYRVAAPRFPAFPASVMSSRSGLAFPGVAAAIPIGRRTVRLDLVPRASPLGSPAIPIERPPAVRVPSFVGMTYPAAGAAGAPGLYVRFATAPPLRPASSVLGLDAFVVTAQRPAAGTLVPAFGAPIRNGVDLGPSIVTLTLGVRGPRAG